NRAPVLDPVGDKTVDEALLLQFTVTASDPDTGDTLTYSASNLPTGATFDPLTQVFSWTPDYTQAGSFPGVTFTVTDDGTPVLNDSEAITITVNDVNAPPVLDPIGDKTVDEALLLQFTVTASDLDGNNLTYSASNLPTGASFDPLTQIFTWTPDYTQAGSYANVTFSVTDDGVPFESDSEAITITVNDVNRAPVLDPVGDKTVDEAQLLQFTVTASDPDGDNLTYSASNLPTGASFDPPTQVFTWTPDYTQAGSYPNVTFTATDDGTPVLNDSEAITITVNHVNLAPVLDPVGDKTVDEAQLLQFTVTASDPDTGDTLTYSATNLPTGATFDPLTQIFTWTPDYTQAGSYPNVTFTVTDDGTPVESDSEAITITVNHVNRAPVLDPVGDKTVDEAQLLQFTVTASDPDTGDTLTYSATNLPTGATFDPLTQIFTWTPDYTQAGTYAGVTFTVTDDGTPVESDSEAITITVNDVNRPPVLDPVGNKSVNEGELLQFTVTASDPDGDNLTYSASNLPTGATFDPLTQIFAWTPDFTQTGTYPNVTFTVTDDGTPTLSDSEAITITVGDVNQPPVLDPIGDKAVDEAQLLQFTVTASDPDGDNLTYSATNLPTGATFDPLTQVFAWTPDYTQAGTYAGVTFTVTDDGTPVESDSEAITITVNDVNRAPVLDPVGDKTVDEGQLLQFTVTASDPDTGDTLTYSATNLPTGATFDPLTQIFTWTPDYTQAGTYPTVTLTVTDDGTPTLSDSEIITITVNDINQPPVLDPVGDKTVDEAQLLQFTVTASDPDGDNLTYSASSLPTGATFDPLTQVFTWTPDYTQAGSYPGVTFTVIDDGTPSLNDSEAITITVNDVNQPPVLAPIGDKTVDEAQLLQFTVTASDPDGNNLTYSASNLPTGATFDPLTQVFTWTPGYDDAGTYPSVTFTVTDDGAPVESDSEAITITVNDINRAPVLDPIGDWFINEGQLLQFIVTASDPDGDNLTYSASNLPTGATFDPGTQVFTWTPSYDDAGAYPNVTFTVTDDGTPVESDSEAITITVNDVNRPPVLDPVGDKTVDEAQLLQFTVTASDPDGNNLTYSASNLPTGANFDPGTQTFSWTPDYTQAGSYTNVTFTVTDDGAPVESDSEAITITVNHVNRAPVLDPVGDKTLNEGELLQFTVTASDPDGDNLTYFASNLPTGATFDPGTQVFSWTPDYTQAGTYPTVTFTVTDDGTPVLNDSETITITVNDVNQPPVLDPIGDKTVDEAQLLQFSVTASDPDGNNLTYSASSLPTGATFDPLTQVFTWTPDYTQAGSFPGVTFTVTDDGTPTLSDSEAITITVNDVNQPPVLDPIGDKTVDEAQLLQFTVTASDPDGNNLTYSASNLPTGATFDPLTQVFIWTPGYEDAGTYPSVTFTVTDDGAPVESDSEAITITVNDINRAPVLDPVGDKTVDEAQLLQFTVTASDPDTGDTLTYSATNLPTGATFDPLTQIFTWTPDYTQAGTYPNVTFTVTDDGTPVLNDSEAITITVNDINRAPVLDPVGNKTVDETQLLQFTVTASDPDGDNLTYSASNLPTGATFDSGTQVFTWTPDYTQAGTYPSVTFTVTDDGTPVESDSEAITITVNDVNRAPVLDPIGDKTVDETQLLQFTVTASDPDGNNLTYSASNLPTGATFDPLTQVFSWTPDYTQAGTYPSVTFTVTDDGTPVESDSETITITVNDVNQPPVLDPIGDKTVGEGQLLQFTVTASDPDGNNLTYAASNLPTGASFDPLTQVFSWTPDYTQAGTYAGVTFTVTDDGTPVESDSEAITITVNHVNLAPVLDPVGDKTVDEAQLLQFTVTASDPDTGDTLTYSATNLPTGASFDPLTQVFAWTPDYTQAGTYTSVTFTVTDDGTPALSDSETITITVNDVNRAPVLDPVGDKAVDEEQLLQFAVSASDPDGNNLTYSASNLPTGASFDPLTQTFTWTPDYTQAGSYANVTFTVTDDGTPALSDSEAITITVSDVNAPPVLDPIGNKTVDEGDLLQFTVTASDLEGHNLTYSATNLPTGASFDPGTQIFSWTPDFGQEGSYPNVTFTVIDDGTPVESDSEAITITVGNVNQPPVLDPIGDKTVNEGELLQFTLTASDPDGNNLTYSASNLPTGASLNAGIFTWTPDYTQAGTYPGVTFVVTDDGTPQLSDSEAITITATDVNQSPVLIPIGDRAVDEGQLLQFTVTASDPDTGDTLTYSATSLPTGASFDPLTQIFTWTPDYTQAGSYANVTFTVTDDGTPNLSDSEVITITVNETNRAPVLDPIGNQSVNEGELLQFTISATDPDTGDALTYSASNLPIGASFDPLTRTFSWTPDYTQAGSFAGVTFTVTDDGTPNLSDSEAITITVGEVNRLPVLDPIGNKSVNEGQLLQFTVTASDPDAGDTLTYSATNLPIGATFDSLTQVFTWTPDYTQAGSYPGVTFTVIDDGTPSLNDSEAITITVNDVNRAPVLDPIGDKTVGEGQLLQFMVTASDPDGDNLTYSASSLPTGATFDPLTQIFTWTPDYTQAGSFPGVTFTVTDDGTPVLNDSEAITITVSDVNRPPVLDPIGNKTASEGVLLQFTVTASDPEGHGLTYSASNLPTGASFDPLTQIFSWTPAFGQAGSHPNVTFTVTDDGTPAESDSEAITITVGDVNQPPVLDPIGNKAVNEGQLLQFTVTASDPDTGDTLTYSATNLPAGASFDPLTQIFTWTPDYTQAG
ncbi:MAG: putative Ig domain-containing protein, partial [Planctomycetota bacterium]